MNIPPYVLGMALAVIGTAIAFSYYSGWLHGMRAFAKIVEDEREATVDHINILRRHITTLRDTLTHLGHPPAGESPFDVPSDCSKQNQG